MADLIHIISHSQANEMLICSFFNIPAQQMMYINAGVLTLILSADIADLVQNDYRSYLIC